MSKERVERIILQIESGDRSLTHLRDPWSFMVEDIKQLAPYFSKSHITQLEIPRIDTTEDMLDIAPFITSAPVLHLKLVARDENIIALAPFLTGCALQSLKFIKGHSHFGYKSVLVLAEAVAVSNITTLSIMCSETRSGHDQGSILPVMAAIKKSQVTHLTIHYGNRIFVDMAKLGQALIGSKVTSLDLSYSELTTEDMQTLMPYISRSSVKELCLSANCFGDEGLVIVSRYLGVAKLERLTINNYINGSNNIGNQGVQALVKYLPQSKLTALNLDNNNIGDEGLTAIGSVLASTKIEVLGVGINKITVDGVKTFMPFLKHSNLRTLNIGKNKLENKGLALIASVLNETNITCLNVEEIELTQNGLRPLIDILNQSALIQLNISNNKIGDEDVQGLAVAIVGSRLLELEMKNIYFNFTSMQYLARALPLTDVIKFLSSVNNSNYITAHRAHLPFTKLSWVNFYSYKPSYSAELEALPKYIEDSGVTCVGFHYMKDAPKLSVAIDQNQSISHALFGLCRDETIVEFQDALKKHPKFVFGYENFNWASNYNPDYSGNTLIQLAANGQVQALKAIQAVVSESMFQRMLMLVNDSGKSALDIARESSNVACIQFIESILNRKLATIFMDPAVQFESCSAPLRELFAQVARGEHITAVDFSAQLICMADLQALVAILPQSNIYQLNFNYVDLTAEMLEVIAQTLPKSRVTQLTFHRSNIDDGCLNVLSDIICRSNIEFIDLSYHWDIAQDSWDKFFHSMARSSLQGINLDSSLSKTNLKVFSEKLLHSRLTYLNLRGNSIEDPSFINIVQALPPGFTKLVIGMNRITTVGFEALVENLSRTSIVYLDASHNCIDSDALLRLADCLPETSLTQLNLGANEHDAAGVKAILNVNTESQLVEVDLRVRAGIGRNEQSDKNNLEIANLENLLSDSRFTYFNYHSYYGLTHYKNRSKSSQSKNHASSVNVELKKQCYEAYVKNDIAELESCFQKLPSLIYVIFLEDSGNSLLHCAANLQNLKLCFLLKKLMHPKLYSAYLRLRNSVEQSPLDLARMGGNELLIDWLQNELGQPKLELAFESDISMIENETDASNLVRKPAARSWHFEYEQHAGQLKESREIYELLDATVNDVEKVIYSYQHHPVPGMDIQRIQVIYNPEMNRGFTSRLALLNRRASKDAFKPKWELKGWRSEVTKYAINLSSDYSDEDFPHVKIMPTWHGTSAGAIESICETGYANLATTDSGFFGKGIYTAHEAEYAYRVYSKGGPIVMNWNAFFLAYPVIHGDMDELMGASNFSNSDAHFVPVVPRHPHDMVNYVPTKPNQVHRYSELVVFQANQCLPRYVVTLQKREISRPLARISQHPLCFFNAKQQYNFLDAIQYVYNNFLVKDYTLKSYMVDWSLTHEGQHVARPNHGLAHALSTALYVPHVITYYIAQHEHSMSAAEKQSLRQNVSWIQLAMLFFVVGRENEAGSREDALAYDRFRLNSSQAFEQYVNIKNVKLDSGTCLLLKNAIQHASFRDGHVGAVIKICHDIDTLRCQPESIYMEICNPIQSQIGAIGIEALRDLVLKAKQATGDRIMGDSAFKQGYQPDLFVKSSTNPEFCWQQLKSVEGLWLSDEKGLIEKFQP